jgi:hypothetical protein
MTHLPQQQTLAEVHMAVEEAVHFLVRLLALVELLLDFW